MNKNEALSILSVFAPGQQPGPALIELCKHFMTPLNSFVAHISRTKDFKIWKAPDGRKLSMTNYAKNNPVEVVMRAIACGLKYPQASNAYAQSRNLDALDVDSETGEPITIMIVVGIIVALAPVVLPFVMGLVDSFIKGDAANKATEAKEETARQRIATEEKKNKMIMMIAGGVVLAVVGIIVVRRLA